MCTHNARQTHTRARMYVRTSQTHAQDNLVPVPPAPHARQNELQTHSPPSHECRYTQTQEEHEHVSQIANITVMNTISRIKLSKCEYTNQITTKNHTMSASTMSRTQPYHEHEHAYHTTSIPIKVCIPTRASTPTKIQARGVVPGARQTIHEREHEHADQPHH